MEGSTCRVRPLPSCAKPPGQGKMCSLTQPTTCCRMHKAQHKVGTQIQDGHRAQAGNTRSQAHNLNLISKSQL